MGGRGSSSGMSVDKNGNPKNKYGSQYHTLHEVDNIKFVSKNTRQSETLMETMTPGRIYVETGGNNLLRIIQFVDGGKRNYVIERDKRTDRWHVHKGYEHTEDSEKHWDNLTTADKKLLAKVKRIWYSQYKA